MDIFCCLKQVPGINNVKIDPERGTLVREGIPSITNPADKHGVELALAIKEKMTSHGGKDARVVAISMGPPQAEAVLLDALAMGADDALLLTDRAFSGADTLATSYTLALAIKKELVNRQDGDGKFLVICGNQAIDGDTAQVGPELAEELGIPSITNVTSLKLENSTIKAAQSLSEGELTMLEARLPALVTVTRDINRPRFPSLAGIQRAFEEKKVKRVAASDLAAEPGKIGLDGSRTQVVKIFMPERRVENTMLSGSMEDMAVQLAKMLKDRGII